MDKIPSEILANFLNYLNLCKTQYEIAYSEVGAEDNKVQAFLHDMEFAPNKAERNKIGTRIQQSRKRRREAKDKTLLYENIYNFYADKQNQNLLKALRRTQNEQVKQEKYVFGNREFKRRVEDT